MTETPEGEAHLVLFAALAEAYGASHDEAGAIALLVLDEFDWDPMNGDSATRVVARIRNATEATADSPTAT